MTIPLRPFGRTGVRVGALALGTMMFGSRGNTDHDDSIRIIHRALDAGINLIDTADVYSQGESEEIVGKALLGRRDEVFLATKFHGQIGENPNHFGNSRRWIVREVENSLRRLQTDHIDLYQVHRPEEDTDFDDTLGALSDLVHQGKIRYIGTSTFEPSAIVEGQWIAERRGRERVVSEQPPTSRGGRQPGRFEIDAPENAAKLAAVEALAVLAEQSGLSLIHLALGFVLEHPAVTAPILGPRTSEQLEQQLGAARTPLSRDVLDEIDKIVPPGVTLSARDQGYHPPALTDPTRRRRS